jgi:hypothetical protein
MVMFAEAQLENENVKGIKTLSPFHCTNNSPRSIGFKTWEMII